MNICNEDNSVESEIDRFRVEINERKPASVSEFLMAI